MLELSFLRQNDILQETRSVYIPRENFLSFNNQLADVLPTWYIYIELIKRKLKNYMEKNSKRGFDIALHFTF